MNNLHWLALIGCWLIGCGIFYRLAAGPPKGTLGKRIDAGYFSIMLMIFLGWTFQCVYVGSCP